MSRVWIEECANLMWHWARWWHRFLTTCSTNFTTILHKFAHTTDETRGYILQKQVGLNWWHIFTAFVMVWASMAYWKTLQLVNILLTSLYSWIGNFTFLTISFAVPFHLILVYFIFIYGPNVTVLASIMIAALNFI